MCVFSQGFLHEENFEVVFSSSFSTHAACAVQGGEFDLERGATDGNADVLASRLSQCFWEAPEGGRTGML